MPKYAVVMRQEISYSLIVEADSPEAAREAAEGEGLPGVVMLDHRYPNESGWEVADEDDAVEEVEE